MKIPNNINRNHILKAIKKINKEGVPPKRGPRKYAMEFDAKLYPCKLLISWANIFANKIELNCHASIFNTYMAQDYLIHLKFKIVPYKKSNK
jgi:hypothetical protein